MFGTHPGLVGRLLEVMTAFLSHRFQRVIIDNVYSSYAPVISGVPQGSVLGPLLFLLFINDITDLFDGTVNVKLYAGDIKIYFEIVNNADVDCLQKGINDSCIWAEKWQLRLSIDKCFHLRVGLIKSVPKATYTQYGTRLNRVNEVRDLGCFDE